MAKQNFNRAIRIADRGMAMPCFVVPPGGDSAEKPQ
jgi:hypothetical protein